jgi:predicted flap endonuclease-1-like 5' DNA nuclease
VIPIEHAIEIALLLLVTYLAGCVLGYCAHMAFRAFNARPRFEAKVVASAAAAVEAVAVVPATPGRKSAARRLAGAVERELAPPAPAPVTQAQQRPPALLAPRGGKADDLRQIKGIGAKTESALNDLGIYHLDQIAAWTSAQIDWLEGRVAVKGRIRREQWVEQAILLMTATTAA